MRFDISQCQSLIHTVMTHDMTHGITMRSISKRRNFSRHAITCAAVAAQDRLVTQLRPTPQTPRSPPFVTRWSDSPSLMRQSVS